MLVEFFDVTKGVRWIKPKDIGLIICDIDGTIADNSHRTKWVQTKPKNWIAYNSTMSEDKPIKLVIEPLVQLVAQNDETFVVFLTGRNEIYRETTTEWLDKNIPCDLWDGLLMREDKDYRTDDIVKSELLDEVIKNYGIEPDLILDDRNIVVDMWRKRGYDCIQVAEGDF